MGDRILRASFDAITAKDASAIINVVNLGISFIAADTFGIRPRVGFGLDIDTVGRAGCST